MGKSATNRAIFNSHVSGPDDLKMSHKTANSKAESSCFLKMSGDRKITDALPILLVQTVQKMDSLQLVQLVAAKTWKVTSLTMPGSCCTR